MDTFLVFIIGLFIGSFYNVVAIRTLKKEEMVVSRSHCMDCNHVLGPLDLIPLFSYLFLRGKCRYCGAKISPLYPIGEFLTGITYAYFWHIWKVSGGGINLIVYILLSTVLVIITISDLKEKIIPNEILLIGFILILGLRVFNGERLLYYVLSSLGAFLLLFLVMVGSNYKMGGGDVKLYAVIGLAIGIEASMISLFMASLFSLLISVPLLLAKKIDRKYEIPFAPFIWAGVLISYLIKTNLF